LDAAVALAEVVVVRVADMELDGATVVEAGADELGATEADEDGATDEEPAPEHRAAVPARTACEVSQDFSELIWIYSPSISAGVVQACSTQGVAAAWMRALLAGWHWHATSVAEQAGAALMAFARQVVAQAGIWAAARPEKAITAKVEYLNCMMKIVVWRELP
jgi:hypothetical protein